MAKKKNASKTTYAKIAGGTRTNTGGPAWKTPEPKDNHEVKDARNTAEAMKAIKTALGPGLREVGAIKNWFPNKEGKIVMSCNNEEQKRNIVTAAKGAEGIEVRERENVTPRLVITGVQRGYEKADLIEMILMK